MAIPAGVSRIVLSGALPSGEIWSSGFYLTGGLVGSQTQATALAVSVRDILSAAGPDGGMRATMQNLMANGSSWVKTTAYVYPDGGPTAGFTGEAPTVDPNAANSITVPNQCALVLSLRTGLPGRRNRGRMYLPCIGVTIDVTNGNAGQVDVTNTLAAWKRSFDAMNAGGLGPVVVVSSVGTTATPVTSLIMDTQIDIQRRRAESSTPGGVFTVALA